MSKQTLKTEIKQLVADHTNAYEACCSADWPTLQLKTGNPNIMHDTILALKAMETHIAEKIKEHEKL